MHLLIDGYNAIHANPKLKRILTEESQESAVKALSNIIASIHDCENCRTTIVFDGKGDSLEIIRRSQIQTFSEVYTPTDMTADDFIEQYCAQHPKDCVVATADNLLDLTAGFFGAHIISPTALFEWAKQCGQQIRNQSMQNKKENSITWKDTNPFLSLKKSELPLKEEIKIEKTKAQKPTKPKEQAKAKEQKAKLSWQKPASLIEIVDSPTKTKKGEASWQDTNPFLKLNVKKSTQKTQKFRKK